MDFIFTSEQEALRESVRRFVEREYDWDRRFAVIRSETGSDPRHWATFAELGWLGAGLSEAAGGFGGGAVENAVIAEELGRGLVTEPFAAHVMATQLLAGSDLVERLVMGEIRVMPALVEAPGRGDWRIVEMTAAGGMLSGAKSMVDGAAQATHYLVNARSEDGLSLYLVDAAAAGIAATPYRTLDNRRVANLSFADVPAQLLASGAKAEALVEEAVDHGVLALCAEALGVMEAALWATRDYVRVRKQFGTAIGNFQAIQHRMADMMVELEMARSALFHALGVAEGDDASARAAAVSAAMVAFAKAGQFVGAQAVQLHGGIGVTEELNISHHYRRLFVIARQFGGSDLHLGRFAAAVDGR